MSGQQVDTARLQALLEVLALRVAGNRQALTRRQEAKAKGRER